MSSFLDAFRKTFDLEAALSEWTDAPVFNGNPKKDLPVSVWLERIRAGCVSRKIPEDHWVKVAQHFMGSDARTRLVELKEVITKVHGGQYRWTWQKFKVAMENMGWEIDRSKKETIRFSKTGSWWRMRKREDTREEPVAKTEASQRPTPLRRSSSSFWNMKPKGSKDDAAPPVPPLPSSTEKGVKVGTISDASTRRKPPARSNTEVWSMRKVEEPEEIFSPGVMPSVPSKTESAANESTTKPKLRRRNTETGTTTVTQAPAWLLNACSALESITSDYPQAMNIISAILITAGSIPSIPAITAGAGGAILASHTAQAIGAVAVGIGQALSSQAKVQQGKAKDEGHQQIEGSTTTR